jgi:hypothetical protein
MWVIVAQDVKNFLEMLLLGSIVLGQVILDKVEFISGYMKRREFWKRSLFPNFKCRIIQLVVLDFPFESKIPILLSYPSKYYQISIAFQATTYDYPHKYVRHYKQRTLGKQDEHGLT